MFQLYACQYTTFIKLIPFLPLFNRSKKMRFWNM